MLLKLKDVITTFCCGQNPSTGGTRTHNVYLNSMMLRSCTTGAVGFNCRSWFRCLTVLVSATKHCCGSWTRTHFECVFHLAEGLRLSAKGIPHQWMRSAGLVWGSDTVWEKATMTMWNVNEFRHRYSFFATLSRRQILIPFVVLVFFLRWWELIQPERTLTPSFRPIGCVQQIKVRVLGSK